MRTRGRSEESCPVRWAADFPVQTWSEGEQSVDFSDELLLQPVPPRTRWLQWPMNLLLCSSGLFLSLMAATALLLWATGPGPVTAGQDELTSSQIPITVITVTEAEVADEAASRERAAGLHARCQRAPIDPTQRPPPRPPIEGATQSSGRGRDPGGRRAVGHAEGRRGPTTAGGRRRPAGDTSNTAPTEADDGGQVPGWPRGDELLQSRPRRRDQPLPGGVGSPPAPRPSTPRYSPTRSSLAPAQTEPTVPARRRKPLLRPPDEPVLAVMREVRQRARDPGPSPQVGPRHPHPLPRQLPVLLGQPDPPLAPRGPPRYRLCP